MHKQQQSINHTVLCKDKDIYQAIIDILKPQNSHPLSGRTQCLVIKIETKMTTFHICVIHVPCKK